MLNALRSLMPETVSPRAIWSFLAKDPKDLTNEDYKLLNSQIKAAIKHSPEIKDYLAASVVLSLSKIAVRLSNDNINAVCDTVIDNETVREIIKMDAYIDSFESIIMGDNMAGNINENIERLYNISNIYAKGALMQRLLNLILNIISSNPRRNDLQPIVAKLSASLLEIEDTDNLTKLYYEIYGK